MPRPVVEPVENGLLVEAPKMRRGVVPRVFFVIERIACAPFALFVAIEGIVVVGIVVIGIVVVETVPKPAAPLGCMRFTIGYLLHRPTLLLISIWVIWKSGRGQRQRDW